MPVDYQIVCKKMEQRKCSIHNEHAAVVAYGSDLKIIACCEAFKNELKQFAEIEIDQQVQQALANMFTKK